MMQKEIDEYVVDGLFREMIDDVSSKPQNKAQGELVIIAMQKIIDRVKERFQITDESRTATTEIGDTEILPQFFDKTHCQRFHLEDFFK